MKVKYLVFAVQVYGQFGVKLEKPTRVFWQFSNKKEAQAWASTFKKRPAFSKAWVEAV